MNSDPSLATRKRLNSAGAVVVGKLLDRGDDNYGFDAQTGEYVDMLSVGIVDPAKVVRLALQGAASIAGLMMTTEVMVAEKTEKGTQSPDGGGFDASSY